MHGGSYLGVWHRGGAYKGKVNPLEERVERTLKALQKKSVTRNEPLSLEWANAVWAKDSFCGFYLPLDVDFLLWSYR